MQKNSDHPTNQSNNDVLAAFGLAPITIECCVQWLGFYKRIATQPDNHTLRNSAIFGPFVRLPTPTGPHPHQQQLLADIDRCETVDSLAEYINEIKRNPTILLTQGLVRHLFIGVDFDLLRKSFSGGATPATDAHTAHQRC